MLSAASHFRLHLVRHIPSVLGHHLVSQTRDNQSLANMAALVRCAFASSTKKILQQQIRCMSAAALPQPDVNPDVHYNKVKKRRIFSLVQVNKTFVVDSATLNFVNYNSVLQ
jgi:hypothetical protein